MCAFARIVSIAPFRASFSFSRVGGSFLEKKRDEKQLSHKNKNKKNIDIPNTNFFLIKGTAAYTTANHLRTTTTTFGDG